ncbi:helix-turn-helix domain-containing protein [Carnobacteriaceae bacterium zg-ZUI78]|nr:helix-turn-helix domain-containing protein [Carnobacteriaceae bacterium zg-ZUI78]
MQEYYNTKGKYITEKERYFIEKWKKEGKSNREISRLLGKITKPSITTSNVDLSIYLFMVALKNTLLKRHKTIIIVYV